MRKFALWSSVSSSRGGSPRHAVIHLSCLAAALSCVPKAELVSMFLPDCEETAMVSGEGVGVS